MAVSFISLFPLGQNFCLEREREKGKDRETKARERITDGLRGREGFGAPLGKVGLWFALKPRDHTELELFLDLLVQKCQTLPLQSPEWAAL